MILSFHCLLELSMGPLQRYFCIDNVILEILITLNWLITSVQAPMHTKTLAMLRMSHVRRELGRAAKEEGARQGHRANGQATMTNGGVSAVISAMTERSRAIGSSAADLLQKEADARRSSGALEHPVSCCRSSCLLFWKACWLSC